jgi:hypothetical protein
VLKKKQIIRTPFTFFNFQKNIYKQCVLTLVLDCTSSDSSNDDFKKKNLMFIGMYLIIPDYDSPDATVLKL